MTDFLHGLWDWFKTAGAWLGPRLATAAKWAGRQTLAVGKWATRPVKARVARYTQKKISRLRHPVTHRRRDRSAREHQALLSRLYSALWNAPRGLTLGGVVQETGESQHLVQYSLGELIELGHVTTRGKRYLAVKPRDFHKFQQTDPPQGRAHRSLSLSRADARGRTPDVQQSEAR
jgi:hypothetical protein